MTGIFDSGSGGGFALRMLHRLAPAEKLVFLRDSENAPYGTRSADEIAALAEKNISRLASVGCDRVLIACCTASTVYALLSEEARRISIPIVRPTAEAAYRASHIGRIAVIATEATVRSCAFPDAIRALDSTVDVEQLATQPLVAMIDEGRGRLGESRNEYISGIARWVTETGADVLVLGCTHFHAAKEHIERELSRNNTNIALVSSAEVGAELAYEGIKKGAPQSLGKEISQWENTGEAALTMPWHRS